MSGRRAEGVEDRVSRIMASIPSLSPSPSPAGSAHHHHHTEEEKDQELLRARDALVREASEARRRAAQVGTLQAYTEKAPVVAKGTLQINKQFLGGMIREVSSHNRREEIADCWREHEMMKRAREEDVPLQQKRQQQSIAAERTASGHIETRDEPRRDPASSSRSMEEEREYWAQLKLAKMKARTEPSMPQSNHNPIPVAAASDGSSDSSSSSSSSSSSESDSDSRHKRKRSRKESSKKKHKKEKKASKKKSSKKRKRKND